MKNLIFRKILHKLKNMFSEKIASDLILNEEREKNKKKNPKRKGNIKKYEVDTKHEFISKGYEVQPQIFPKKNCEEDACIPRPNSEEYQNST